MNSNYYKLLLKFFRAQYGRNLLISFFHFLFVGNYCW